MKNRFSHTLIETYKKDSALYSLEVIDVTLL